MTGGMVCAWLNSSVSPLQCFHVPYSALTMFISSEQSERDSATAYRKSLFSLLPLSQYKIVVKIILFHNFPLSSWPSSQKQMWSCRLNLWEDCMKFLGTSAGLSVKGISLAAIWKLSGGCVCDGTHLTTGNWLKNSKPLTGCFCPMFYFWFKAEKPWLCKACLVICVSSDPGSPRGICGPNLPAMGRIIFNVWNPSWNPYRHFSWELRFLKLGGWGLYALEPLGMESMPVSLLTKCLLGEGKANQKPPGDSLG